MKSDSSFLYANYNEFFVLSDFFCDPTVYSRYRFLSITYKFGENGFWNVQLHHFSPFSSCNTSIFKHIE